MRKLGLLLIGGLMAVTSGFAQNAGMLTGLTVEEFVDALDKVEGYFFIGKGEDRDMKLTLKRDENNDYSDLEEMRKMDWFSYNSSIASVNDEGYVTGNNYGETILSIIDGETVRNYVIFVSPKITIVSPEGAIYSYHKVYNQKTRVQFTEGSTWQVNSVTRDGEPVDISVDGWYESEELIDHDVRFHVTMEGATNSLKNVKITVNGSDVTIDAPATILNSQIQVFDMWGNRLYSDTWPADGTLRFDPNNHGIFTIVIMDGGKDNLFKIIIE